jgi:hypothetical protein
MGPRIKVFGALTSSVSVAQVGESPHIAQADGIADAREQEVDLSRPLLPLGHVGLLRGGGGHAVPAREGLQGGHLAGAWPVDRRLFLQRHPYRVANSKILNCLISTPNCSYMCCKYLFPDNLIRAQRFISNVHI